MAHTAEAVSLQFRSESLDAGRSSTTKLILNGQDITKFTTDVTVSAKVDSITTAYIGLLPREGFDFSGPAAVVFHVQARPGYTLIEEVTETGKRWRVERE